MEINNIDFKFRELVIPYREGINEVIIRNKLDKNSIDNDPSWIKMCDHIWIKYLCLDTKNNSYTNFMYCTKSINGPLHYHHGSVNAFIINGTYGIYEHKKYQKEKDYADAGSYVYAPAGTLHRAYMKVHNGYYLGFSITQGAVIYLNDNHEFIGYSDVFTQIDNLKKHYETHNLPLSKIDAIIQ